MILDWVPAHFPRDDLALARFDGTRALRARRPAPRRAPGLGHARLQLRPQRGPQLPRRQRAVLAARVPRRRPPRRRRRLDALPRLLAQGGRVGAERVRRPRGPRGRRVPQGAQRGAPRARAGRDLAPPRSRRRGRASRGPTYLGGLGFGFKWNMGWMHDTLAYFQQDPIYRRYHHHELTFSLVYAFTRELHPAAVARRGRARQGLAARQDAGRPLAEAREPARAVRLHVGAPRQEAAVHGPGVRARRRSGATSARSTGTCSRTPSTRASSRSCATSTAPTRTSRRCGRSTSTATGFWWTRAQRRRRQRRRVRARVEGRRARRCCSSATSRRCRAGTTGSGCRAPGRWVEALNTDSTYYGGTGRRQPAAASRPRRSPGTASRSRPRSRCRRWAVLWLVPEAKTKL